MKTVFVSGCYEILHAGHLQFFKDARALGDQLVVCIASDAVIRGLKHREPAVPIEHRLALVQALRGVDKVVVGETLGIVPADWTLDQALAFNFAVPFDRIRPDILAVTEDERFLNQKREHCANQACQLVVLPKTPPCGPACSTSEIRRAITGTREVPLRVDFAGGWLDVAGLPPPGTGGYVVNCAISPLVSLTAWPYQIGGGLGGSAAKALLDGKDPFASEAAAGVGWQDPAVITETGLCVWAGCEPKPRLILRTSGYWLHGLMAIRWMGNGHSTPDLVAKGRPYQWIAQGGRRAFAAVKDESIWALGAAIEFAYTAQLNEEMAPIDSLNSIGRKYLGSGWGGYALYLFDDPGKRGWFVKSHDGIAVEPFDRWAND